jgi:hypothetical protein
LNKLLKYKNLLWEPLNKKKIVGSCDHNVELLTPGMLYASGFELRTFLLERLSFNNFAVITSA